MAEDKAAGRWGPWIAGVVLVALCVGAVIALAGGEDGAVDSTGDARAPIKRGTACEPLAKGREAATDRELIDAIREAEQAAIKALDETGNRFGRPERMALQMSEEDLTVPLDANVKERLIEALGLAETACEDLIS